MTRRWFADELRRMVAVESLTISHAAEQLGTPRGTASSAAHHLGVSVKAVQRHLGHASATTTLDTYAHLFPDAEDVTRQALGARLAAMVSPLCQDATAGG